MPARSKKNRSTSAPASKATSRAAGERTSRRPQQPPLETQPPHIQEKLQRHMAIAKEIGAVIAEHRKAKKVTQVELADALGCDQARVSDWERGIVAPESPTLLEIMAFLGIEVGVFPTTSKKARKRN
jgi:ribosome-binding protein aMBF1 (putative translation factor)